MQVFFLVTSAKDQYENKKGKKNFYLGHFCLSEKNKLSDFKSYNTLNHHWGDKKMIFKKYTYLKKISNKLFKFLVKKLNIAHEKNKNENYWKIIIFPWVCYYTATLYDRWETTSLLKKKNKLSFFSCKYVINDKAAEITDIIDWMQKMQSDVFNNILFHKIFEARNFKNIKVFKKKYKNLFINNEKKPKKFSFFRLLDNFLSKIALKFNSIYFDKFKFRPLFLLKICLKNLQIPSNNINTFENINFETNYNPELRNIFTNFKNNNSEFERFLYSEIKNYLPKSYLENYREFIKSKQIEYTKKKKSIISMYSTHFNDYFKIFLAEAKLNGSRYIHSKHGVGLHATNDALFNHFSKISDRILIFTKNNNRDSKKVYLGSSIFPDPKFSAKNKEKKKTTNKLP